MLGDPRNVVSLVNPEFSTKGKIKLNSKFPIIVFDKQRRRTQRAFILLDFRLCKRS
jgi:hypothetical protein